MTREIGRRVAAPDHPDLRDPSLSAQVRRAPRTLVVHGAVVLVGEAFGALDQQVDPGHEVAGGVEQVRLGLDGDAGELVEDPQRRLPGRAGAPRPRARRPPGARRTPGRELRQASAREARVTSPQCSAASTRTTRSRRPRSRAALSRTSSGASTGSPYRTWVRRGWWSRGGHNPARRGRLSSSRVAAKTGTNSGSCGSHHSYSAAAVMWVKTASGGRTSRPADSSRRHSARVEPGRAGGQPVADPPDTSGDRTSPRIRRQLVVHAGSCRTRPGAHHPRGGCGERLPPGVRQSPHPLGTNRRLHPPNVGFGTKPRHPESLEGNGRGGGLAGDRVLQRRGGTADLVGRVGGVVAGGRGGGGRGSPSSWCGDVGPAGPRLPSSSVMRAGRIRRNLRGWLRVRSSTATSRSSAGITRSPDSEWPERGDGQPQRLLQRGALDVLLLEYAATDVGGAAHHREAVLVGDLAVVGEPVDLVVGGRCRRSRPRTARPRRASRRRWRRSCRASGRRRWPARGR